ncbi:allophanate hydrolase subunit 1 [Rheinheimera sediminis]|uniref:5-oxoprolinase subunit B family protein n=1 Tax=Rheinheimera sp. YQF-1 TaxID=2499626 RepID=UPI000FD6D3E5|nr:allophanate hydrolase subunit 1 [Rheinheimera sp. YQF-1]RVT44858.1 allophanate hydrolase subunit 1 [Rheinheimera sp. YQF-1]
MISLQLAGENALILYLSPEISAQHLMQLQYLAQQIRTLVADQLQDIVPSYASLLIVFKPEHSGILALQAMLQQQLALGCSEITQQSQRITLPVYYHTAWDLGQVAQNSGLSAAEVIELHQARDYRVYAIGFAPGFAYLGELDSRLSTPRLVSPRPAVPKGAVAIADRQTAVYPAASPGGWNILGLCPTPLFQAENAGTAKPLMPFRVGDQVRFQSISRDEFLALGGELPQELR